jgi:HEAT repeat protein
VLVICLSTPRALPAITAPEQVRLSLQQLEEFRTKGIPDEQWPALLETLGHEDESAAVRTLIRDQQPFPAGKLVEHLSSPRLAVRLGALDLLEDAAGETFGFDPWQETPTASGNPEALAHWKAWVEKGTTASAQPAGTLSDETFRAIAHEIMSGNRDRASRAMQRLDGFGLVAIARLEAFFMDQPNLEAAPRAALKSAEYRVALLQAMPKQAAGLARDLALGRPEIQSTALSALGKGGPGVLPVIADFLTSPDPLVRETAADAAFAAGKQHAVGLIVERLKDEQAESVLHAMLRGLGQYAKEQAHADAIAHFLEHPSENVVISALEALGANQAGEVSTPLAARLADPRWRVRAAALETIGKRNLKALMAKITDRLQDSDLFVRVSAVEALKKVGEREANAVLIEQFALQNDLKAPILQALFRDSNQPPPAAVWDALEKAPPEIILQCLDTLEDRDDHEGRRVPQAARFATHPNRDVAAAALRLLAGRGRHTAQLLAALKSDDAVKQDAVLDELHLPAGFLGGKSAAAIVANSAAVNAPPNPLLNRLYEAILRAGRKTPASAEAGATASGAEVQAAPPEMRAVLERFRSEGSPRQRFRAAVVLAGQADAEATRFLLAQFDTLSSLDRRSLAGALTNVADWSAGPTRELAIRLLRDPADDVREKATEAWIDTKKPERLAELLAEFSRPGSRLSPDDIYGWELDRLAQDRSTREVIFQWSRTVLDAASAPISQKVLAVILLGRSGQAQEANLEPLLTAPDPWLRRAAYRALGLSAAQSRIAALLRDDSALVRAALPFLAAPHNHGWLHWFDDAHHAADHEDFDRNSFSSGRAFGAWAQPSSAAAKAAPETVAALEKLARDPSDLVRFEAQFALLRLGHSVDAAGLGALAAAQPADAYAGMRIGNFLESNYARLGKGYGVLVPLATEISESNLPKLLQHFGLEKETAFTSFAALAQLAPEAAQAADLKVEHAPALNSEPPRAASFRVIFFYKPGCRGCDRTRDMLNRHAPDFPQMLLEERNIEDSREALFNETLSARFRLKDTLHQVTPAVFTQAGPLVHDEITFPRLGDLLRKTSVLTAEPAWAQVAAAETASARQTITQRYEALSFGVVAAAGLLDGINPCAFATIILLLSYLQVARRTPGEILAIGGAFIVAVFVSYFLVGLGLAQVLAQIAALRVAGLVLNYALAGFALVIAVLSFRDAQLAARGELGEMTLQLPAMLKEQIRTVIRTGARASRFVAAAFVAGVLVSFLELACTGQVYLPTILYMLRSGRTGAAGHLVLYNVAFIAPLIIVFLLAWSGPRSEALLRFQREHTSSVKFLTGLLFLLLTVFLLFGHLLVPQLATGK